MLMINQACAAILQLNASERAVASFANLAHTHSHKGKLNYVCMPPCVCVCHSVGISKFAAHAEGYVH